jgi:hypothetical protein
MCKNLSLFFTEDFQPSPGETDDPDVTQNDETIGFHERRKVLGFCGNEDDSGKGCQTDEDGQNC